jgi:hypothetical protein
MSTDYFGFRFEIVSVKEMRMNNGEAAYVIFLNITNLEPKARIVTLSTATYITKDREQLEQDLWLLGYLPATGIDRARIKGNAHRKAGLVFYKKHLSSADLGDSIYVEVQLADSKKKLSLRFDNTTAELTEPWAISEAQVEDMEVRASPRALSKTLTRKIERLDAFEERLGISLDKLSVSVPNDYNLLTISGEVHQTSSASISGNIEIVAVVYDAEGIIVQSGEVTLWAQHFAGFDVFKLTLYGNEIGLIADRIRIFPKSR